MLKNQKSFVLFSLLLALILTACERDYFFHRAEVFDDSEWHMDDKVQLEFSSADTSSYLNFYLDIRNNDFYKYRNIFAFVEMTFPNGRSLTDTIHFAYMASPEGRWTGKGVGSSYDNSILYKQRRKLPLPGLYSISIQHGMRDSVLLGIEKVGLHIESSSQIDG